ncbi:MAG: hypothetical protein C5B54_10490 [Acidobacteria bacterium]|nr:MAG: hypothetical protein C5B54_10490 [Acidobacteriota bacterium]
MKIRPTDSSGGIPQEPEEINQKKQGPEINDSQQPEETTSAAPAKELFPSAELSSLQGVTDKTDLGNRFIKMAVRDYQGESISSADLNRIETMLQDQVGEDPFFQSKLDKISSLLAKAR